ncbi:hypothetical protein GCM10023116_20200 [Kistimonas scapharcae]|uniref:Uncharacterized protein n=2 Tax=Kistimonas scapharcae TaxID=1036133 RepID=A0ABP8V0X8_9GAMM
MTFGGVKFYPIYESQGLGFYKCSHFSEIAKSNILCMNAKDYFVMKFYDGLQLTREDLRLENVRVGRESFEKDLLKKGYQKDSGDYSGFVTFLNQKTDHAVVYKDESDTGYFCKYSKTGT